jgi:hypothetical protein
VNSFRTWEYKRLEANLRQSVRINASRAFGFWKENTKHPSLNFECIDNTDRDEEIWSVRIGARHRALCAKKDGPIYIWFWIGTHGEYDGLI